MKMMMKCFNDPLQDGADNVRALYKRTLELDIEYKRLLIKKNKAGDRKMEYEKR